MTTSSFSPVPPSAPQEHHRPSTLWHHRTHRSDDDEIIPEPEEKWYLRLHVVKDGDGRGDVPIKIYTFPSLSALQSFTRALAATLGASTDPVSNASTSSEEGERGITIRHCGVDSTDAMGGRIEAGRTEAVTIEYDSGETEVEWTEFVRRLQRVEERVETKTEAA